MARLRPSIGARCVELDQCSRPTSVIKLTDQWKFCFRIWPWPSQSDVVILFMESIGEQTGLEGWRRGGTLVGRVLNH